MSGTSMLAVAMSFTVMSPLRFRPSSTTHRVSISWSRILAQARRTVISPSTPGTGRMSTSRSCGLTSVYSSGAGTWKWSSTNSVSRLSSPARQGLQGFSGSSLFFRRL